MPRLPSIQALRALEAFARHGTVWQAAEELCLTRSAVSHQLRLLERDLGFALTSRAGVRVRLTPQGAAYAADVRRALAAIAASGARNAARGAAGELVVSCTPGFAANWLCPRLGSFAAAFPEVALSVVTPRRLDDAANPHADLFITFGAAPPPGTEAVRLKPVAFTPLCSPALLNRLEGLPGPQALLHAPLVHLHDHADWEGWFALAGLPVAAARRGVRFSDITLVEAATVAGQGVSLGDEFIAGRAMAQGLLVRPFDLALPAAQAYHLVTPAGRGDTPAAAAFRDWLIAELPPDRAAAAPARPANAVSRNSEQVSVASADPRGLPSGGPQGRRP